MSKFNWNRFYDELDEADPKKFPYWMWMVHEMGNFIGFIFSGIIMGFLIFIMACVFIKIMAKEYPDKTFTLIQTQICDYKK